jgi:hypothetical protein
MPPIDTSLAAGMQEQQEAELPLVAAARLRDVQARAALATAPPKPPLPPPFDLAKALARAEFRAAMFGTDRRRR